VYFHKEKSQTFGKFKGWLTMVEVETERKPKKFWMNHAGEFMFGEFIAYCKERGIK